MTCLEIHSHLTDVNEIIHLLWHSDAVWRHRSESTLAWRHQAITWTNVDLASVMCCGIHLGTILKEMLTMANLNMRLKIISWRSQPHLPGAKELNHFISKARHCVRHIIPQAPGIATRNIPNILISKSWNLQSCNTLGPKQMATISQTTFSSAFFNEIFWILNEISLIYVAGGLVDTMAALVQQCLVAEPIFVCFTGAYIGVTRSQWVKMKAGV